MKLSFKNIWNYKRNIIIFAETNELLMRLKYDSTQLVKAVKTKRCVDMNVGMRAAADQIGVSLATLSRIENGKIPDALTLALVCKWVSFDINDCFVIVKKKK